MTNDKEARTKETKFTDAQWKRAWKRLFDATKQLREMGVANGNEITVDIKVKTAAKRKKK